ncbi:hypothetical protein D3C73_1487990 [compost metagenome]
MAFSLPGKDTAAEFRDLRSQLRMHFTKMLHCLCPGIRPALGYGEGIVIIFSR